MGQQSFLPEIDRKLTQAAVEAALEKYRIFKFMTFEAREASTTAGYTERFHGPTNQTSDQTASIAIYNADQEMYRQDYCDRVERAVKRMPRMERFLIEARYMTTEHDYITDQKVYNFEFKPPISAPKYIEIRWRAFYKLALDLRIVVEKPSEGE
ncbi:ArpU family phage packaging/lysis transcriptional regulator [Paenibacillus pabuli]|uniref:ArpU family phage packaging/lysis transcriptional regulator n=1 Tax=Paenibacillus pabuli TaxID=1472 RepID=UPI001FFED523|nr:ArpU family phage packaging/lysis transcriptional regulator [Paenibacillus pabuli]UPK45942.1 transcriptional regulator [Paenibacillus pabuli]